MRSVMPINHNFIGLISSCVTCHRVGRHNTKSCLYGSANEMRRYCAL